jgi:putative addiction module component (TIGR02574 family)
MKSKTNKTTMKASKVLRDAMNLPPADRADIASCLYGSLNGDNATQLHPAWGREIEQRIREVEEGKVKAVPVKKAIQQIFADA